MRQICWFIAFALLGACSSGPKRVYFKEKNIIRVNKLTPMGHRQDWETDRPIYHHTTKFIDVDSASYMKKMQRETRRNKNDLCVYEFESYELSQPCGSDGFVPGVKPIGPYPGVIHGDFDGDGLADSYAVYLDHHHRKGKRILEVVWFGGEDAPRALRDFQRFYSKSHVRYDEKQVELSFVERFKRKTGPEHDRAKAIGDYDMWVPVKPYHYSACRYVIPPQTEVFGRINTFFLKRAIVASVECGTFNQKMYIFSKDHNKVMVAPARGE